MSLPVFKQVETEAERSQRLSRDGHRTIIAGSRKLRGIGDDSLVALAVSRCGWKIHSVLSGRAQGIDQAGEKWAKANVIPVKEFPANWDGEGKGAGYNRNLRMAWNADALIAIWDGQSKGTKHMIEQAKHYELRVFVLEVVRYWVSGVINGSAFTCLVATDSVDDRILWTASMLKKFVGQPIENLIGWAGGVEIERI